jgi:hypothetical protein
VLTRRRRSPEAAAEGVLVFVVAALQERAAQRTPDEALFAACGALQLEHEPSAAQRRALTPRAARRCAWYLSYGPMYMRATAAALLHTHSVKRSQQSPALAARRRRAGGAGGGRQRYRPPSHGREHADGCTRSGAAAGARFGCISAALRCFPLKLRFVRATESHIY